MLALRWHDVDREEAALQVRATVHYTKGGYLFTERKTKYSRRRIALPRIVVDVLRGHRTRLFEERSVLDQRGKIWTSCFLIAWASR